MKKPKKIPVDELRSEYSRSDFGVLVRGKCVDQFRVLAARGSTERGLKLLDKLDRAFVRRTRPVKSRSEGR
jgi:hypothetical protein